MKRKITVIISLLLVIVLSACNANTPNKTGDLGSKKTESNSIQFADEILEKYARIMFGKLSGDITQEDLDKIKKIEFDSVFETVDYSYKDYDEKNFHLEGEIDALKDKEGEDRLFPLSYEDLKYFRNLQVVSLRANNADFIKDLKHLKYISIGVPIIDLSVFKNTSIEVMHIYDFERFEETTVTNYEALLELDNLKYVDIGNIPADIEKKLKAKGVEIKAKEVETEIEEDED